MSIGKPSINGQISMAMLNNQRVYIYICIYYIFYKYTLHRLDGGPSWPHADSRRMPSDKDWRRRVPRWFPVRKMIDRWGGFSTSMFTMFLGVLSNIDVENPWSIGEKKGDFTTWFILVYWESLPSIMW